MTASSLSLSLLLSADAAKGTDSRTVLDEKSQRAQIRWGLTSTHSGDPPSLDSASEVSPVPISGTSRGSNLRALVLKQEQLMNINRSNINITHGEVPDCKGNPKLLKMHYGRGIRKGKERRLSKTMLGANSR
jgi:hypothetical protein